MAKARQVVKGKILKKEWHPIKASRNFESTFLGEGYVTGPDMLMERHLTINLANLTGDIRQQGINLNFRIKSIDDGAGVAEVIGYEASSSQLKRLVRRGVDRFDDVVDCTTLDGQKVRIKPFAVSKSAASKHKLQMIRTLLRKTISEEVAKITFDDLVKLVISNKFQTSLKALAKKVFPLKSLEIRRMEMVGEPLVSSSAPEEKVSEQEAPEEPAVEPAAEAASVEEAPKEKPAKAVKHRKKAEKAAEEAPEAEENPQ